MSKKIFLITSALCGVAACSGDSLNVRNPNDPDVDRAYATPALVEGVFGGFGVLMNNPQRASESVNTQSKVLSGENFASVANFGMAARAAIPRSIISNELGNDSQVGNVANWNSFSITSRTAANAIRALRLLISKGQSLGSPAQDARALSFGFYTMGLALGNLSLAYDSAAIVTPLLEGSAIPELSGAAAVNKAALAYMDTAIAIATSPAATTGVNGFPFPAAWISSPTSITQARFLKIVRSQKARLRAGVARNAAQRAAVDWAAVIADATGGLGVGDDHQVAIGGTTGWNATYDVNQSYVTGGWSQLPMYYYGMADTSGSYATWLNSPRDSRTGFTVLTADKRWPSGATRAAQQAVNSNNNLPAGQYIRNRLSGDDVPVIGWGNSQYDHRRWGALNINSLTGNYTDISGTEIAMLAAEGYIRTGNLPAAVARIDSSRKNAGLPLIGSVASATAPISSNARCTPQVPVAPAFTTTECGNIFEALKYEKRMETAFTGYLVWFTDNRGWGDLIEGTVIEWPVPYQEMQARQKGYYNGSIRAPKGTYGF